MNKRNNTIFNFNMYIDTLKRLRIFGFLYMAITVFISVMIPVARYISIITYGNDNSPLSTTPIFGTFSFMMLVYIICAPSLTGACFSFLTKRKSSDYYHAFPQTRGCIFNTLFAAVVTWITSIILSCFVSTAIAYTILGNYFVISLGALFKFLLCIFAASILVCAATALACAITGTGFTNFIVTGLILFLPRLLLTIIMTIITDTHILFVHDEFLPLFDNRYNLVFHTFTGFISNKGYSNFIEYPNILYTLVLAIIYITAAYILFIRRKSEAAGMASVGKKTQCIIRIAIALPVCMIPISYLFELITAPYNTTEPNALILFDGFILYVVAIAIMLIYELLSTRKLRSVVKALPSVAILGITNVAVLGVMLALFYSQINYCPEASEVEYFTTTALDNSSGTYFSNALGKYHITDPEAIAIITESLKDTINNESSLSQYRYQNDTYSPMVVSIKSGLFVKTREIYFSSKAENNLMSILSDNDDIKKLYMELPEYDPNTMSIFYYMTDLGFDNTTTVNIYNSLREEVKSLDFTEWKQSLDTSYDCLLGIGLDISDDYNSTYTELPITSLTPKTFDMVINATNKSVGKDNLEMIKTVFDNKDTITSDTLTSPEGIPTYLNCTIDEYNYSANCVESNIVSMYYDINDKETSGIDYDDSELVYEIIKDAINTYGNEVNSVDNSGKKLYHIHFDYEFFENDTATAMNFDNNFYVNGNYFVWR